MPTPWEFPFSQSENRVEPLAGLLVTSRLDINPDTSSLVSSSSRTKNPTSLDSPNAIPAGKRTRRARLPTLLTNGAS